MRRLRSRSLTLSGLGGVTMTRKDYVAIAEALKLAADDTRNRMGNDLTRLDAQRIAALFLCQVFVHDNPRFSSEKFLTAATLTYDQVYGEEG